LRLVIFSLSNFKLLPDLFNFFLYFLQIQLKVLDFRFLIVNALILLGGDVRELKRVAIFVLIGLL